MSKIKIIRPSEDVMALRMQREKIPANGAYETTKSTPSSINDTSAHVMEYSSY